MLQSLRDRSLSVMSYFLSTTSSDKVQAPLVIVQRKVVLVPAATPVTVLVGDVGVVIVPLPLNYTPHSITNSWVYCQPG
jgi:hypothetical protein